MEKYSLKWNSHYLEAFGAFELLRRQEVFVDVTLSCEGELIRVHKLILCACSNFFDRLMRESGASSYPIVFFKETRLLHLKLLIKFMYEGEVEVPCEMLPDFLKLAEQLEIKGLKRMDPLESSPLLADVSNHIDVASPASSPSQGPQSSPGSPDDWPSAGKRKRTLNNGCSVEPLLDAVKGEFSPVILNSLASNHVFAEVSVKEATNDSAGDEDNEMSEMGGLDYNFQGSNCTTSGANSLPDISPQDLMDFSLSEEEMMGHFDPATLTPSRFVAKLMGILCTTEEMATHSLCGYMTGKDFKPKLDPRKVEVILRYTVLLYPYVSESLIRRSIQQKLNNVDKYMKQKKKQVEKEKLELQHHQQQFHPPESNV